MVGSGKSTFINSLLCETTAHKEDGTKIEMMGNIAYVC